MSFAITSKAPTPKDILTFPVNVNTIVMVISVANTLQLIVLARVRLWWSILIGILENQRVFFWELSNGRGRAALFYLLFQLSQALVMCYYLIPAYHYPLSYIG